TVTLTAITTPPTGGNLQWTQSYVPPPPPATTLGTSNTQTHAPIANSGYTVTISYNTCTASATASVTIGPSLSILASPGSINVCPTESTVLTASSSALSYTWWSSPSSSLATSSNTFAVIGPGTYTVEGQNGACTGSTTVFVGATQFTPGISSSTLSACAGE